MCTSARLFFWGVTDSLALHTCDSPSLACQFPHVLAELRFSCFSSDTVSLSLNHAMNTGRCFVILFPLRHLDFFEMVRNEDDLELAKRFDLVSFSL